ncbi:MAG: HAD family hydrolase [Patescibacteria group bacterium]
MSDIKKPIIIFDVDGTLVVESDRLLAQTKAVAYHFGGLPAEMQAVLYAFFAINDEVTKEKPHLKNNISLYMKMVGERLGIATSEAEAETLATQWTEAYKNSHTKPVLFPDAYMCLETLSQRGFRLVVASGNTVATRTDMLEQTGIAQFFSQIYAATDVGYQKQDVRFWESILSSLDIAPEEKVMVIGNQLNDDILQPIHLGHLAFLIERPSELKKIQEEPRITPTAIFNNLQELVDSSYFS